MDVKSGSPAKEMGPMLDLASVPREPSFNDGGNLEYLMLHHFVSVCEAKGERYQQDPTQKKKHITPGYLICQCKESGIWLIQHQKRSRC